MCSICSFRLSVSARKGPEKTLNLTTWYDITVQQEYLFLKNIYSTKDFLKIEILTILGDFYAAFEYFLEIIVLLKKSNNMQTNDPEQQQKNNEILRHIVPNETIAPRL